MKIKAKCERVGFWLVALAVLTAFGLPVVALAGVPLVLAPVAGAVVLAVMH